MAIAVLHVLGGGLEAHPVSPRSFLGFGLAAALLAGAATLLLLEQTWAEDVNLAFFKVNVWVGLAVLLAVLAARLA